MEQPDGWVSAQISAAERMLGMTIERWSGVEMAVDERPEDGSPVFDHPDAPCVQLVQLMISLASGEDVVVRTYQNDDVWGLEVRRDAELVDAAPYDGIYRFRDLVELPVGRVSSVEARMDDGDLAELLVTVDDRPLLLIAGEIHPDFNGNLLWARLDESVLAFTVPSAAESISWRPPRDC